MEAIRSSETLVTTHKTEQRQSIFFFNSREISKLIRL
jgi:hypothetical protein